MSVQNSLLLRVENLCYRCDEKVLFEYLNLSVNRGDLLQVVGKNGVGKTTLLKILAGLLSTEQGSVHRCLHDIFYQGHLLGIKSDLTVYENLRLDLRLLTTHHTIMHALREVGLSEHAACFVRSLSQGQKQRCALAKLLLSPATLWLLDEPFNALDTEILSVIVQMFVQHQKKGGAVIFTSHRPLTVSNVCIQTIELVE